MELLSPAGTLEAAMAAFQYGADAVYLGMKNFSARADAGNFTLDELATLIGIAHNNREHPRKVYVAVNTLLQQDEVKDLVPLLVELRDLVPDAILVQDAAVAHIVRDYLPELELHASTQLAIHNVQGVKQAHELGFSRVVAARELTIQELTELTAVPDIEIEAFIHGALCYSYSGLCLLSARLNGTSGNRGDCSYVCRNFFNIKHGNGTPIPACCPFSMKDLELASLLPTLRKAGVASLKIEGRKKTPLYVAAVTNYYRKLIDGNFAPGEEAEAALDVRTIFSRPTTRLFAMTPRAAAVTDTQTLGPRGIDIGLTMKLNHTEEGDRLRFVVKNRPVEKHDGLQLELPTATRPYGFAVESILAFTQGGSDRSELVFSADPGTTIEVPLPDGHPYIPAGTKICCSSSQAVKRKYTWPEPRPSICRTRFPVFFKVTVSEQSLTVLSQPCVGPREMDDIKTTLLLDNPLSPARKPDPDAAELKAAFSRLGDTAFSLAGIRVSNPGALFVPKSILNELRRKAANDIQHALEADHAQTASRIISALMKSPPANSRICEPTPVTCSLKIDSPFFLNLFDDNDIQSVSELVVAIDKIPNAELQDTLDALAYRMGGRNKIRIAMPPISRTALPTDWEPVANLLFHNGWRRWEIANIGAWKILRDTGADIQNLNVTADWPLYATNSTAAELWRECGAKRVTASPEDSLDNICTLAHILGPALTVPIYQDPVLARSAVCAMSSINGFCPGKKNCTFSSLQLTNNRAQSLLAFNNNCSTVILDANPLNLTGDLPQLLNAGARSFRADFLWKDYPPTTVRTIWRSIINAIPHQ